jgi:DNA-binding MarR family transcriptional regulator
VSDATFLRLKNPKNWFAAGEEMRKATTMLTDGAFKIFVYICLHAHRHTGTLETNQTELARNLHKSQGNIRKNLRELQNAGMCNVHMTQSRHRKGVIEITPEYWPYDRKSSDPPREEETLYIDAVKKLLSARACVGPSFSVADERLARGWFEHGISLEHVEQAILIACSRKYIAWRNGQGKTLINSLRYFESALEEIRGRNIDPEYWNFIRFRMQRVEKLWLKNKASSTTTVPGSNFSMPKKAGQEFL